MPHRPPTDPTAPASPAGAVGQADSFDIVVDGRPAPYGLRLGRAAVVVVDMQNDFVSPGGSVEASGGDVTLVAALVEPIAHVLEAARGRGIPVVYLQHCYRPDLADLGPERGKNALIHRAARVGLPTEAPDGSPSRVLVRDTWSTRIVDRLAPRDGELVIPKTRFSGFHGTTLDEDLRRLGVRDLILTGCTTSVCVEATLRDAMARDYRALLLTDCVDEPQGRAHHDSTVALVESSLGWTAESADLCRALA
ncbi:isochorismatase family cysteine hydrolase [Streptomyces sp. DSM 44915]|uniref:Isochorismatase family cysteine hydrolase n=1 Tax=Streptomyces chisholmiae TaxID=3075540 RepID=A0ABU2JZX7_9ACTN|nr:isochorismatase family cysteine hydrolase [Streptomyces sp. DSM 44915]MDT0269768.1 isochorismatase family cysteine hydrolase [Streptomyces sp. DSM 44915]